MIEKIPFVILATYSLTVHAEQEAGKSLDAVVEIKISVPANARAAERFGTNRVASGVVIDTTGHILIIGFQAIEAEKVKIVRKDPCQGRQSTRRGTVQKAEGAGRMNACRRQA